MAHKFGSLFSFLFIQYVNLSWVLFIREDENELKMNRRDLNRFLVNKRLFTVSDERLICVCHIFLLHTTQCIF